VHSRILAFRPASVVERLDPRSAACPISTRDLLAPAAELGLILPLVRAPLGAVARGVLVAAKEMQSVLGLALPAGVPPEPWFEAVTKAADEVAAGLPIFLSAEVVVADEGATEVEHAFHEAWRLVGAGLTHLAVDVAAVTPGERSRVIGEIAEAGIEHGICVEVVVSLSEGAQVGSRAARVFDELARRGAPADIASVRCPAPADANEARLQAAALARICQALGGIPVMRRGPVTSELLGILRGSPLKACEDGGVASARAVQAIPAAPPPAEGEETRENALERAAAELSEEAAERLEARAYVDGLEFMEGLGLRGSARALARALERRLEAQ
jgi:hypothetical protein